MVRGFCCQETAKIVPVGKIDPAAASGALRLPRDIRGPKGLVLEHGECDFDSPDHPNFKTAKIVPVGRIDPGCCVWRSVSPEGYQGIKGVCLEHGECDFDSPDHPNFDFALLSRKKPNGIERSSKNCVCGSEIVGWKQRGPLFTPFHASTLPIASAKRSRPESKA